jgi:hypothetical protein
LTLNLRVQGVFAGLINVVGCKLDVIDSEVKVCVVKSIADSSFHGEVKWQVQGEGTNLG